MLAQAPSCKVLFLSALRSCRAGEALAACWTCGVSPLLWGGLKGTAGHAQANWDGEGFGTLPEQCLDEAPSHVGRGLSQGSHFLSSRGGVGSHRQDTPQLPRVSPFPGTGPRALPEGCSETQRRGHTWFWEDRRAASSSLALRRRRAGQSRSSSPSPCPGAEDADAAPGVCSESRWSQSSAVASVPQRVRKSCDAPKESPRQPGAETAGRSDRVVKPNPTPIPSSGSSGISQALPGPHNLQEKGQG